MDPAVDKPSASAEPDAGPAPDALAALLWARVMESLPGLFGPASADVAADLLRAGAWVRVPGGSVLFREGDPGDALYVLVAGRLVATTDGPAGRHVLGVIAPGESVGEMGVLGGQPRTATVTAARDSVLLRIGRDAFQRLVAARPEILAGTTRLIIHRMTEVMSGRAPAVQARTIAVVPLWPDARWNALVERLGRMLQRRGPVLVVDRAHADAVRARGDDARDAPCAADEVALSAWLDEQELRHAWLLLRADEAAGAWTERCVRQADTVVLLASAGAPPAMDERHRGLARALDAGTARRELVLLHEPGVTTPSGTSAWLASWRVDRHHHVRRDRDDDLRRVARFLAGEAVGLVLSGGGARAFTHLGAIRALREAGIVVDAVGGTSQGAIVAAMMGMEWDDATMERWHRRGFTLRNPIGDYALFPHLALAKGKRVDAALAECFGTLAIEDAWRTFYCVSTNLSLTRAEVHRRGMIWRALRASVAIPGVLPPAVLGEHLHVDGGLLDNLPVSAMREHGVRRVVALDVAVNQELRMTRGGLPSAADVVRRWISGEERANAPGLGSILVKSLMISSMQRAAEALASADLYLNPAPAEIGFLEWKALDRAIELGYRHARAKLAGAKLDGLTAGAAP